MSEVFKDVTTNGKVRAHHQPSYNQPILLHTLAVSSALACKESVPFRLFALTTCTCTTAHNRLLTPFATVLSILIW
ncbi:hypothetical protein ABMB44_15060 [Levilactobacillus brevis]